MADQPSNGAAVALHDREWPTEASLDAAMPHLKSDDTPSHDDGVDHGLGRSKSAPDQRLINRASLLSARDTLGRFGHLGRNKGLRGGNRMQ